MQMITLAGVDFIFFDHTNAVIYGDAADSLEILANMLDIKVLRF